MRELTIGRSPENDIQINDNSVSRKHAVIIVSGSEYSVRDMGSTNGTYVNGMRVNGVANLRKSDILKVGNALVPWMNHLEIMGLDHSRTVAPVQQQVRQPSAAASGVQQAVPNASGALVCGIIGVVFSFLGLIGIIGLILSTIAVALGATGVSKYKKSPGDYTRSSYSNANAGMILGIIGISIFLIVLFLVVVAINI